MDDNKIQTCPHCGEDLPMTKEYFRARDVKRGTFRPICKVCENRINAKRGEEKRSLVSENDTRVCGVCGEEKILMYDFRKSNRNKQGHATTCKQYQANSPACKKSALKSREMYRFRKANDPEYFKKVQERTRKYKADPINKKRESERVSERRKNDPKYRLIQNARKGTYRGFKNLDMNKTGSSRKLLGCDFDTLINHLTEQFTEGMTLENHGKPKGCWHIDHIIPLASAKTEEEVIKLCHYTNLQPLWAEDNYTKGDKLDWDKNSSTKTSLSEQ